MIHHVQRALALDMSTVDCLLPGTNGLRQLRIEHEADTLAKKLEKLGTLCDHVTPRAEAA